MRTILSFLMLAVLAQSISAQTSLPKDKATGKITYRFSIPINGNVSKGAAYEMVSNWFGSHTKEFTRSNTSVTPENICGVNTSRLAEVEHEFKNTAPVQSLDPESNRIVVRVVTKYFGENGGTIHALYLQSYMIVTVGEHEITCELTDFRYNHFNEHSFQFKRIQNWGNSTSLDPVATLEYLVENEQSHTEFGKFFSFFNKDVNQMITHFSNAVKTGGALTMN